MSNDQVSVAVIGTGRMGSAIARRLSSTGARMVLWNRTLSKAESLANEINGIVAEDIQSAVQGVEIAVLSLSDDDALFQVLSSMRRMDGLVVVNTGTHTPRAAISARNYVEGNGGCYVESPIVGGPGTVERGEAIVIAGGRRICVGGATPVLEAIASDVIYLGEDPGKAQALKLAFNNLLINTVNVLAESMHLVEAYGIDIEFFKRLLAGTVFSAIGEKYIDRMREDPGKPAGFTIELASKDLFYALQAGFDRKRSLYATSVTATKYREAVLEGLGGSDYTRIYWKGLINNKK